MLNLLTHQAKVVFIWREEIRPDVLLQLTGIGPHRARNQTDHLIIKDITKSTVLCSDNENSLNTITTSST